MPQDITIEVLKDLSVKAGCTDPINSIMDIVDWLCEEKHLYVQYEKLYSGYTFYSKIVYQSKTICSENTYSTPSVALEMGIVQALNNLIYSKK